MVRVIIVFGLLHVHLHHIHALVATTGSDPLLLKRHGLLGLIDTELILDVIGLTKDLPQVLVEQVLNRLCMLRVPLALFKVAICTIFVHNVVFELLSVDTIE